MIRSLIMGLVALVVFGCHKEVETPSTPRPVTASESIKPAPQDQPVQFIGVPTSATADPTIALGALTQALRKYAMEHKGLPRSFAELVAAGYVNNVPTPPPGKKFEINPKTTQVVLVNQ